MASKMDELERRGYAGFDKKTGGQLVSSVPVRLPVGFSQVDNFANRVREIVRSERFKAEMEAAGAETFEEADDFNIPDDEIDPATPYEADFDVPSPVELKRADKRRFEDEDREDAYRAARRRRYDVQRVSKRSAKSKEPRGGSRVVSDESGEGSSEDAV